MTPERPTFEASADETLAVVRAIYAQRGDEYSDTWSIPNQVATFTEATLRRFGISLGADEIRLLQLATLIDVKGSRLIGAWKADSVDDAIAYMAVYRALREKYEREASGGAVKPLG